MLSSYFPTSGRNSYLCRCSTIPPKVSMVLYIYAIKSRLKMRYFMSSMKIKYPNKNTSGLMQATNHYCLISKKGKTILLKPWNSMLKLKSIIKIILIASWMAFVTILVHSRSCRRRPIPWRRRGCTLVGYGGAVILKAPRSPLLVVKIWTLLLIIPWLRH